MLYPMFMMIVLITIIGIITLSVRFKSVKSGKVRARSYKLMDAPDFPELVKKTTNSFNNQFEVPVLFFAGCLAYLSLGVSDTFALVSAWAFVILRFIHAYIHLTYNHVFHRLTSFWLSYIALMALWINLIVVAG